MSKRLLLWFRNDLRIHDNALLDLAAKANGFEILPVYCLDPRHFGTTEFGSPKTAHFRAKFLYESVEDLKRSLRRLGSDLLVVHGRPEDILPRMLTPGSRSVVSYQSEVTSEEMQVERAVQRAVQESAGMQPHWGATLYHLEDLPLRTDLKDLPDGFTPFKDKVEKKSRVRAPLPSPASLPPPPAVDGFDFNQFPSYTSLGVPELPPPPEYGVMPFQGGETVGLQRMQGWIHDRSCLQEYFNTRNGLLGADYSSKFSPWLAHGCLSPRAIYSSVKRYEAEQVANKSTYWLIFELIWRDFYRFLCMKYGNKIFMSGGAHSVHKQWNSSPDMLRRWKEGTTGVPFVDANMRELNATGFMSNRGRQNVASYLVLDLNLDWRLGADYFESLLIDSDVCSNYGNWNAAAGLTGGRVNKFNLVKQSKDYDPHGDYIRTWVPELAKVPAPRLFEPWALSRSDQERYGVKIGEDYPNNKDLTRGLPGADTGKGKGGKGKGGKGGTGKRDARLDRQDHRKNATKQRRSDYDMYG